MPSTERALQFEIAVDGSTLPASRLQCLSALVLQQQLSQPSACELSFAGPEAAGLAASLAVGRALRLSLAGAAEPWFDGRVSAQEHLHAQDGTYTLVVRAYDALFVLRNRQAARAHVDLTLADLAQELVGDLGLTVRADVRGPVWPRLLQTGTDFELLDDVAQRCGAYLQVHAGVLQLLSPAGHGEALNLDLHDHLLDAMVEHNGHGACTEVQGQAWDPWRSVALQAAAGAARGRAAQPNALAGSDRQTLLGLSAQDTAGVEARAQAEQDRRSAASRVLRGTARGDARLRPGQPVRVRGLAPGVEDRFVLAQVRHTVDPEHGFLSELSTALPAPRGRGAGAALALTGARVTQIDDPDKLGRIKVALPAYGELESDWLQWLAPGAGRAKGLVAPPDVDDQVLVLLDRADPAQAVVLGSLWGEAGLPEGHDTLGPKARQCFLSPGGQRISLDDDAKLLRLESADGSLLELAEDRVRLRASRHMTLEAPGHKITLRAKFIDFERA